MKRNVQQILRGTVFMAMTLLVLSGARLHAQAYSGLTGIITDQQGAVMVGVDVTLADSDTGFGHRQVQCQRRLFVQQHSAGRQLFPDVHS